MTSIRQHIAVWFVENKAKLVTGISHPTQPHGLCFMSQKYMLANMQELSEKEEVSCRKH